MAEHDLQLTCPACHQPFGIATTSLDPQNLRVVCGHCAHALSTDEILIAMATSLNELLDKTRDHLADKLDKSKP